jgi:DNA-binding PadR family transcriptional regulator
MARRSSSSAYALLGLLTIEPMSGYDLGQIVGVSIGHIWRESYGQIYPNLKKLAASGFVDCKTAKRKGRPDRRVYSITRKGRERLEKWLSIPPQPEIPRNEMLLKLFFGSQVPTHILVRNVEQMVEEHRALLQRFTQVERDEIDKNSHYPDAPFWKMAARFGQFEMEAHLKWAEETLLALRKRVRLERPSAKTRNRKSHATN